MQDRFTRIQFRNYKALKRYSVALSDFNVLVGPNNAGKSTIVSAFRILSEGIRKARSRKPGYISHPSVAASGYIVPLEGLPVATENIFTNYDETEPAVIEFHLVSKNKLKLIFPENDLCYMVAETGGKPVDSPAKFKKAFDCSIGMVPILGPVEHNEPLYQLEAARLALLTHRASRNFRNIWYHYPDEFDEFRKLILQTWPGMDIERPEVDRSHDKPVLHMFCPEARYPREIFWAGFGFQVWCQMLTFIVRNKNASLLIIDEPDIYLHSDLQRQLLDILRQVAPDVLIATHSTEIITEADPNDLLVVNKRGQSAKRIKNASQLQPIFGALGSNLNPTLTQLAKSRRAVFVEGKDFQLFAAFARKLGMDALANRSDFAVIPAEGFNPQKVKNFAEGIELTLGTKIAKAIVFDRDYRPQGEVTKLLTEFEEFSSFARIHACKEIENFLLVPSALTRAADKRVSEKALRSGEKKVFDGDFEQWISELADSLRSKVQAQYLSRQGEFIQAENPHRNSATINQQLIEQFESDWSAWDKKLAMLPGKQVFSLLNAKLQEEYGVSLTPLAVVNCMQQSEVMQELRSLLEGLEQFRNEPV